MGDWILDADFLKINDLEFEQNKEFFESSKVMLDKTIITRGREGCIYITNGA